MDPRPRRTTLNAAAEKGAPVSRAEPPLSPAQLKTLAAAQEWRRVTDTLPGGPRARADKPAAPPLSARLSDLLPKGLDVVGRSDGRDAEYGHVVVDDGKGRSLVEINVQPDMRDVAGDLFHPGDEALADGTRVVISAFNAATPNGTPTRTTPTLTLHQLRTIALNSK
ncbi:hypothetical protein ACFVFQ_18985 [Streptomyces sp. NPDC057743]|uniref:hypothetical protein n=1 Tax=Streptomyces sp. NPDC057743 TaxID=3346236 RepID=UPI00369A9772